MKLSDAQIAEIEVELADELIFTDVDDDRGVFRLLRNRDAAATDSREIFAEVFGSVSFEGPRTGHDTRQRRARSDQGEPLVCRFRRIDRARQCDENRQHTGASDRVKKVHEVSRFNFAAAEPSADVFAESCD